MHSDSARFYGTSQAAAAPVPIERPPLTPVWVLLDALCVRVPGMPHRLVPDGVDMTGRVRGLLVSWHATAKGDWLALVNFSVPYADEHRGKLKLTHQLVPAYALQPREQDNRAV